MSEKMDYGVDYFAFGSDDLKKTTKKKKKVVEIFDKIGVFFTKSFSEFKKRISNKSEKSQTNKIETTNSNKTDNQNVLCLVSLNNSNEFQNQKVK